MGTPDFSVPALKRLAALDDIEIPMVVTQPDRPKGRGKKLAISPVKKAAQELGLKLFQPETLKEPSAAEMLSAISPDFFVVAAFGQILTKQVLDIPSVYPINIHASLLPKYRGASPIQAAILNMDKETGITTIVMAEKMDAGDILLQDTTPIKPGDTAQTLHDRLSQIGADLIVETLCRISDQTLSPTPQDHSRATYVKLLKKQDGKINWHDSSRKILAHINAMTPWPSAFTRLNKQNVKIFKAALSKRMSDTEPGTIFDSGKTGIFVSTGSGSVAVTELMGTSGKRLTAQQYLCGHDIKPYTRFDS